MKRTCKGCGVNMFRWDLSAEYCEPKCRDRTRSKLYADKTRYALSVTKWLQNNRPDLISEIEKQIALTTCFND